jgi:hypothetical protein
MSNAIQVMFFESRKQVQIVSSAVYYAKLSKLRTKERDQKSKDILTNCLRQITQKIHEQNNMVEFQNMLVKLSGYKLKK